MITFIQVKDNKSKIETICSTIAERYRLGEKVLIYVATEQAACYIDQLLWRSPEESFLPHSILDKPTNERIVITLLTQNLNQAENLFNLSPTVPPFYDQFRAVYELMDETDPAKLQASLQRKKEYELERQTNVIRKEC
jgi:DNA polymerase-3 subunit chi